MTNHPHRSGKFELAFWGGPDGIKYRRYHKTIAAAREEALRVHRKMDNAGAHAAIVYDTETDEQVCSIM